ncbi:MAG TPA: hypothetical protein VGE16_14610 [Albitalea sp.]
MKSLQLSIAAALLGALCVQPALAAKNTPPATSVECEASKAAQPGSTKSRADVKAEAKGASVDCEASKPVEPTASTKARADVKAQAKTAAKAGEVPQGEAGQVKK